MNRRNLLTKASLVGLGVAAGLSPSCLLAADQATLEVAYAGSMTSLMEGSLKSTAAQDLHLEVHGHGQGANALAQLIVGGSLQPDVFISVTPGPMLTVLKAGKADTARPIASTEMVIAYSPASRFAPGLEAAAKSQGKWWEVMAEPGFRFGRSDPATDPQGRNIVFVMMLAARKYGQPDLVQKVLGPLNNPQQISLEASVEARLQSGQLDAASAYRIQPGPFHLPYIPLSKDIDLSGSNVRAEHPDVRLTTNGKTYFPEPLIFYAAALKSAPHPRAAASFLDWLSGDRAQGIFRKFDYDAPGGAPALHA